MSTYYETLGVATDATQEEIKKAYKRLAKEYHPDRTKGDKDAEAKFKEVASAYEVIGNEEKRKEYDYPQQHFDPFFDFFKSPAGGFGFAQQDGFDIESHVEISFEEAAFGVEKSIVIPFISSCVSCSGNGYMKNSDKCSSCEGRGKFISKTNNMTMLHTCQNCAGTGYRLSMCETCFGKGKMHEDKKLDIKIPSGIDHGQHMNFHGKGGQSKPNGQRGNLYVVFLIRPHAKYTRDGLNVHSEVALRYQRAILGGNTKETTLKGEITLQIPPGTNSGMTLRVKGKGISAENGKTGDHLFKVRIENPLDLSKEERELLEQIDAMQKENKV